VVATIHTVRLEALLGLVVVTIGGALARERVERRSALDSVPALSRTPAARPGWCNALMWSPQWNVARGRLSIGAASGRLVVKI
jgi:hypothetical protein